MLPSLHLVKNMARSLSAGHEDSYPAFQFAIPLKLEQRDARPQLPLY